MVKIPTQEELGKIKERLFRSRKFNTNHYHWEDLPAMNNLLLARLKENSTELKKLLEQFSSNNTPYRFYHQSFKVYRAQDDLKKALELFRKIAGEEFTLNEWYLTIVNEALAVGPFKMDHNDQWLAKTRPQMEAFFHTKYFLEWAVDGAKTLEEAPNLLDSGWAAVLYLFGVR